MTLAELIDKQYGVKTTYRLNPLTNSIGTSATKFLGNNPNRLAWYLVNLSANTIYVSPDIDVSSNKGIAISPNGGMLGFEYKTEFELVGYPEFAVASDVSQVYVLEILSI